MTPLETVVLATYFFILLVLAGYGWHRYYLVYAYMKHKDRVPVPAGQFDQLPMVTVQLPIYNEMYVVDRLIEAVAQMDYPRDRFEVQVLDDSTDETRSIAELAVRRAAAQGLDITYLHRTDRTGFKAGALEAGMRVAKGEFIAIFDADFLPSPDFLHKTIHHFTDPKVAVVQARWGHINARLLAADQDPVDPARRALRARARRPQPRGALLQLQRHGRHLAPGGHHRRRRLAARHADRGPRPRATARSCAGWKFHFVPDVVVPAELPVEMNAFKSQQHRWAKGSIQTCRKLLPRILAQQAAVRREGRGVLPPERELQLRADGRAVGADVPGDGHPLQHGLVRDAAHRRAAVLCGDRVGGQLLHRLPARVVPEGMGGAADATCRS